MTHICYQLEVDAVEEPLQAVGLEHFPDKWVWGRAIMVPAGPAPDWTKQEFQVIEHRRFVASKLRNEMNKEMRVWAYLP